ncbi:hypothetical protein [Xanthocytophaga agilis]|uniref:Uncharacterized protein n=1 Tax=Xanthocytophaga agilis TaxID=3048010 RepID=A0AAE3UF93_9BACT|nr:hypothetical protein [Xanthocytophaga agilis]MDJ1503608.1 hypothetical protein [Xanthocytophaga agilis]
MNPSTTFTALKRISTFVAILRLVIGLVGIGAFSITKKKSDVQVLTDSQMSIYIPNSYLEVLIRNLVLKNQPSLFDTSRYVFNDLRASNTTANTKSFRLTLNSKATFDGNPQKRDTDYYNEEAVLHKDIVLRWLGGVIGILTKTFDGKDIDLYKLPLKDLSTNYQDPRNPFSISGKVWVLFNNNSIGLTYSKDTIHVKEICNRLDNNIRYQNLGVSAIIPHNFINSFSRSSGIRIQTGDGITGSVFLRNVTIKDMNGDRLGLHAALDSDNEVLLPRPVYLEMELSKKQNTIQRIFGFNYDNANLSSTERSRMERTLTMMRRQIDDGWINQILTPQMQGIPIVFSSSKQRFPVAATGNGFFSYEAKVVITTINLF